ncbi:hypothetical protein M3P05_19550 [Sansalvadorimonas sp. 2012CJ34-2]|uniref:Uncharacterized protein n=1 Tax=Parendozoicomonas callyspongiae TaxID=2942213 RepID=A0ABT0PLI3_9GAMM|nr:hypothetical protein [Sansalvadorimonas sp. 2012CJ34-2]MCL6272121.1 hypothetical protein [Sansalvadorimonas sp. 2012CJ34-2]
MDGQISRVNITNPGTTGSSTIYDDYVHNTSPAGTMVIGGAALGSVCLGAFLGFVVTPMATGVGAVLGAIGAATLGISYLNGTIDDNTITAIPGKITQGLKKVDWNQVGLWYKRAAYVGVPFITAGALYAPLYIPALCTLTGFGLVGAGMVAGRYIANHF